MATPSSARLIDVRVFPAFRSSVRAPWLRRVARAALAVGDPDGHAGASVAVAGDDTLHELNARFRGLDEPTDVLSFANADVAMGEPAAARRVPQRARRNAVAGRGGPFLPSGHAPSGRAQCNGRV